jgi:hypothetical protein
MRRPHLTLRRQIVGRHFPPQASRSPADLLGLNHPFARGDELQRDLWRQSLVTAVAMVLGAAAATSGHGWGLPLLVAAASTQLALTVGLARHARSQRERARELIIAGRSDLPLPVLRREHRRLQRPRQCRGLAHALEDLLRAAERWPTLVPTCRPVFDPRQVRAAAPQLRAIAARLRTSTVPVRALARVERLLTSGASPLYGRRPEELRSELKRIEAELDAVDTPGSAPERSTLRR